MHVYRWDLDKTYLQTDIHSVRGLVRAAIEGAGDKRTVPGASTLLRGLLAADPSCRVAVVSGSPKQMRAVLLDKLARDGVRVDDITLKDNLGNLRRGRLKAVRGQLGYKLPALLRQRSGLGPSVQETLFGDDAEVDALVYTLYAEAVAGTISEAELAQVMKAGDAYDDQIRDARAALNGFARADAVEDIFILLGRGLPLRTFRRLGPKVIPVFCWLQAALVLWRRGRLRPQGATAVVTACQGEAALPPDSIASTFQDTVRRGLVSRDDVTSLLGAIDLGEIEPRIERALDQLGSPPEPAPGRTRPDYLGFLREAHRS